MTGHNTYFSRGVRAAFTLIELLIVVAIIAILAAIALPNFMEAQTRAKVSRARSDLRTLGVAMELYLVDQNRYPSMLQPGFSGGVGPLRGSDLKWWYIPNALSTPVAYVSSADLRCPFGGDLPRKRDFPDNIWRRYSYENTVELAAKSAVFSVLLGKYGPAAWPLERIGKWRLLCNGPDRAWSPMVPYDATNGTGSLGNIMRTQRSADGTGSEQR